MLSAIRPHCEELTFVSNGKLNAESEKKVSEYADEVIQRENKGFDVWAYKTTLEKYGWEKLSQYDEVIMMNHTIMGPVYPFDEVFREMDSRTDLDFWGLTTYHGSPYDPYGKCRYKYLPLHIQSHFIAVRKKMIADPFFHRYWKKMPAVRSYAEAVCYHEAIFTKTFEDRGFHWAAYVDTSDMHEHNACPIIFTPVTLIKEKRCPIFKRRSFFHQYDDLCRFSIGYQGDQLMELLEQEHLYDTRMIWENILRTCNMADIMRCMCLNRTLPDNKCASSPKRSSTALIMHLYYEDQYSLFYNYALSMPNDTDVYITVSSEEKQKKLQDIFSSGPWNNVEVRLIENRGRDVSALLVGCSDVPERYDLICFVHDKRSHSGEYGIIGESFLEHCCKNVLASKEYVQNVIGAFEKESRMGMLFAPPPCFGGYLQTISNEWSANKDVTEQLRARLGLTVPVDFSKEPVAPLGTMFWFRSDALKDLFAYGWKYSDFPEEPNELDGTILHAIERIYPFSAQQAGYYSVWCETEDYARRYMINLYHMLRKERVQFTQEPLSNIYRVRIKRFVKARTPKPIWKLAKRIYHAIGGRKWVG